REQQQVKEELLHFFRLRLKTQLQEKGIRYDVIDAVLASDIAYPQLVLERAQVWTENVAKEEFKSVVEAFSRVANLSAKGDPEAKVNGDLLDLWAEREPYAAITSAARSFASAEEQQDDQGMFEAIAQLAPVIHRFFDEIGRAHV